MSKGTMGVLMKAFGANDYRLTVTSTETISDNYLRLSFSAGGLLTDHPPYPTQWVRLWIPGESGHQRGYTLIDQNPSADQVFIEFALHDGGPASDWARTAAIGDHIEATMLGSKFELPSPTPSEFIVFGDSASLPAINSLLDAIGDTPARIWLEWQDESEAQLPVRARPQHEVTWLQRVDNGRLLRERVATIDIGENAFAWVACDWRTTRAITKTLKSVHRLPKTALKSQAYWK